MAMITRPLTLQLVVEYDDEVTDLDQVQVCLEDALGKFVKCNGVDIDHLEEIGPIRIVN